MRSGHAFPPLADEDPGDRATWQALLGLHIPKTAGNTLRQVLNRQYGVDNVLRVRRHTREDGTSFMRFLESDEGRSVPSNTVEWWAPEVTRRSAIELRPFRALVGHFWFGLHEYLDRPATYLTVLRDPFERGLSKYAFYRAQFGLSLTLEEYVRTPRDFDLDNGQTRRLCGTLPDIDVRFAECTDAMLESAKINLRDHFSVVGILERFDESFLLMARTFGWRYPTYDVLNVSPNRRPGAEVSDGIRRKLMERNRFDFELYAFAKGLFEEQLAKAEPPIDAASLRRFRRVNFFYRLPTEHPVIGPPVVAGLRAVGNAVKPLRRAKRWALPEA